jgi:serine/threonine-protein kinase mTOR
MVRAQMLSELEEIIAYKQFADQPERQQTIRKTWVKRFAYASPNTSPYTESSTDYKDVSRT